MNLPSGRGPVLLATFGTLGDVHPFVALAKALQSRGYDPIVTTSAMHRAVIEDEGIAFVPMRPDAGDIAEALGIEAAGVFHRMVRSPWFILDEIYLRFLSQTFDDVLRASEGARLLVVHSLLLGAKLAAEARGLPTIHVALSPIHLQSARMPSLTPPLPYRLRPRTVAGRIWNRALREILRRRLASKLRPVRAFRRGIGLLSRHEDVYLDCGRSNGVDAIVGFYSRHFADLQPDHPCNAEIVGFPFYRSRAAGRERLTCDLDAFLDAGTPPIVFTLGSFAIEAPGRFYDDSLDAAHRVGRRALLLAGARDASRLRGAIGPDDHVCAYAPHDLVFVRAACIVHHGGMGTTAEALRSGRPQLVVPFFGDQPDHAVRLEGLGVARILPPKSYTASRAAAELETLLAGRAQAAAVRLADLTREENGADAFAALIARILPERDPT